MALPAGTRVGIYEVIGRIGEGGMGQVLRARDTRLNRDVALKVLPEAFAADPDRLARFAREAQTLASLNHSNIAQIHGLEDSGDVRALVMEFVEGDDLSQRIAHGPIPLGEALPIATQIALALEAAHDQGVIHRDLKPANIKVRPDGTVKVLDFGLAKAMEPAGTVSSGLSMSPTITTPALTQAGVILGTAAYMSPEQAKGRPADARSDIWAYGCVLFEMLAGKPVFAAETVAEILSDILKSDPDWHALPPTTPPAVRLLLKRCLHKDRTRRMRDIADARFQIEEALHEPAGAPAVAHSSRTSRERLAWIAGTLALAVALTLQIASTRSDQMGSPEMRLAIPTALGQDLSGFAISPDGRTLVYQARTEGKNQLWLRPLDAETTQPLPGSDGGAYPFWSPDSRSVAFFAAGQLKRIDVASGLVQILAEAPENTRGGAWNSAGTILFTRSATEPLYRVAASGGKAEVATEVKAPHLGHRYPQFLPDGRHFLFFAFGPPESQGIYVGSLDSKESNRVIDAESAPVFAPPDYVMFARQGAVFAQRLNLDTLQTVGEPVPVSRQVVTPRGTVASVALSASHAGLVAYRSDTGEHQLRWVDRSGRRIGVVGGPDSGEAGVVRLSPDGRTVAVERMVNGNNDVWLLETGRDARRRFTADPAREYDPIWSPDGTRIVFGSTRKGVVDLYVRSVSGAEPEALLWASAESKNVHDWSSDGRWIVFASQNATTARDLWALPMEASPGAGEKKPIVVARTGFAESFARFSPDGRWIAYQSNESGRNEIYVQTFPGASSRAQISTGGGSFPQWQRDGKALFYIDSDNRVVSVTVALTGSSVDPGTPVTLFSLPSAATYEASPDGQRFLLDEIARDPSPITILLNWKPLR